MKRSPLKRVSKKQSAELRKRDKLRQELLEECKGLCMRCGQKPDWRGLSLAHKIALSQGGKTNRENCELWCGRDHSIDHHIREV